MTAATRPTRGIRSPKRMLTIALALFLTLAGTSVAQATWTTPASTLSASVAAGTLSVKQSGFGALAQVYLSSPATALTTTKPVTVTNTGSVPAQYILAFTAPAGGLSTAVMVQAWVSTAAACTDTVGASGPAAQNWTMVAPFTGTLAAQASTVYCVRTSLTPALRFTSATGSFQATSTVSVAAGSKWAAAGNTDTATQSLTSTTPLNVAAVAQSDHSVKVTWSPPADASKVSGYQVYRVGTSAPLATVTSLTARSYVDTGLNVETSYSYYVVAIDSNGNVSPATAATAVTTSGINPSAWYKVKIAGTETCIDGEKEQTASGTLLIFYGCKPTLFDNQAWQFAVVSGTTYTVRAKYVANRYWDLTGTRNVNANIQSFDGTASQTWSVVPITGGNGTFTIKNVQTNKCLDNVNALTPQGDVQVVAATCVVGSASQAFTLTNVG